MEKLHSTPLVEPLTTRELDILHLIADGLSDREIAQRLTLAVETVKWYNKQIYSKLGVHNRTEAAGFAAALSASHEGAHAVGQPTSAPRHNLPTQITSFVGRQRELAEIVRLLEDGRLLSVTGLAGCGKTRLALQVAYEVRAKFHDGVYWVPLAPVASPDNLLWAIAEHLDLQLYPQTEPLQQLIDYFRAKTLLLVLDNFEHLLDGAGLVANILQAAPNVRIIVTSRERLNLYGEVNYAIAGLSLLDESSRQDTRSEAAELFAQRALAAVPSLKLEADDLEHVAHICRLVEGMPLGIELAATWTDVLSPKEIASEIETSLDILEAELRGLPDTQTSMRASFARSWNLLDESQKTAFRRLAVFRAGFTRHSASAVTGVGLRTLQALVAKSLLRYDPSTGRYEIHELLRQYAAEQLIGSGDAKSTYEAHGRYFADFMTEHWLQLKGHHQKIALLEIENDLENIRAAWDYWIKVGNIAELRKFLHSFWVVYDIRGWYPAGIKLFERAVELVRGVATEEAQSVLGWILSVQGLYSLAGGIYRIVAGPRKGFVLAQEGVQIVERISGYDEMMIIPLISLFVTASQVNEIDLACAAARDCLELATRIDDHWAVAKAKQFLAIRAIMDANFQTAEHLAREALQTFERNGDKWSASVLCIEVLGLLAISLRDFDGGIVWIEQGLREAEEIDFKYSQQMAYWQLGFVATLQEDYPRAAIYWRKALELGEAAVGSPILMGFVGTSNSGEWGGRKLLERS